MMTRAAMLFPTLLAAAALSAGCEAATPLDATLPSFTTLTSEQRQGVQTLRAATARYHDLRAAIDDGFVFLHGCEVRPGEGAVGTVYLHVARFLDGVIDPAQPDALIYEPRPNGGLKLAGIELVVPRAAWTGSEPPSFVGVPFQFEDEFDAYGLHIWAWLPNPSGMFAEAHPNIGCAAE